MRCSRTRLFLIVLSCVAIPLSFIHAPFPQELVLQHSGTVFGLACLTFLTLYAYPSSVTFTCLLTFLWLHIIGARWIYTFVPYDEVIRSITGTGLQDYFGWERNHYDRLVHFASGLLGVPPASEFLQRSCKIEPLAGAMLGILCVVAVGAFYEIFEWQIAVFCAPDQAEAYNGQQGDMWDPQKDLALAAIGACAAAAIFSRWIPRQVHGDRVAV